MWVLFRQNCIGFYKKFLLYTDRCKCSYLQGCKTKILYFIICSLLIVSLNPCASLISITLSFFSLHLSLSLSLSLSNSLLLSSTSLSSQPPFSSTSCSLISASLSSPVVGFIVVDFVCLDLGNCGYFQ